MVLVVLELLAIVMLRHGKAVTLTKLLMPDLVKNLHSSFAQKIMTAILEGTKTAYIKQELPFMEIVLPEIAAFALGEFMQFKMIEMMYLGKLMNVNTFDQPNVELYKQETKKILTDHEAIPLKGFA